MHHLTAFEPRTEFQDTVVTFRTWEVPSGPIGPALALRSTDEPGVVTAGTVDHDQLSIMPLDGHGSSAPTIEPRLEVDIGLTLGAPSDHIVRLRRIEPAKVVATGRAYIGPSWPNAVFWVHVAVEIGKLTGAALRSGAGRVVLRRRASASIGHDR